MAGISFGPKVSHLVRDMVVKRLEENEYYTKRFKEIFGKSKIDLLQVSSSIAAFERSLIFNESPWDHYINGNENALTKNPLLLVPNSDFTPSSNK